MRKWRDEWRSIRSRIIRKFLFCVTAASYVSAIDRPEILVRFIRAKFSGWPRLKRLHWPFSSFDVLHIRYILYIPYYGQSEPENANIRVSHIGFTIFTIGFITRSRCARTNAVTAEFHPGHGAGPHGEARVNGLKTFKETYCRLMPCALWHINVTDWQVTVFGVRNNNVLCNSMKNNILRRRRYSGGAIFRAVYLPGKQYHQNDVQFIGKCKKRLASALRRQVHPQPIHFPITVTL